jgi:branched-chain amino acid transport system substrate-binding protein
LIGITCVAALVIAACGDDSDGDAAAGGGGGQSQQSSAGPAPTGPTPTGTKITLGLATALTGRTAAAYLSSQDVANAWVEMVNKEKGGVNGHPVEIAVGDNKGNGEGAAAAVREVVEEKGAIAVVVQDSTTENVAAQYLPTKNVPYIGGSANGRPAAGWPNTFFHQAPSSPSLAAAPLVIAKALEGKKFGAAVCAEVPACSEAAKVYDAEAPTVGVEFVGLVTVGAADPSYQAPCLDLVGKGTDTVLLGLAPTTAQSMIEECTAQGFEGSYMATSNSVIVDQLEDIEGLKFAGALNGFPWWADAKPVQEFRDAMARYAPKADYRTTAATTTWAALELFRKTMANGPAATAPVTSADVTTAYQGIKEETLDGLLPQPITYSATGAQPLVKCFWPFKLEDGKVSSLTLDGFDEGNNGASGDLKSLCYTVGG